MQEVFEEPVDIAEPNAERVCDICQKPISQLEPFGGPGDPCVGDFTGLILVTNIREEFPEQFGRSLECRDCVLRRGSLWELNVEDELGRPLSDEERLPLRYKIEESYESDRLGRQLSEDERTKLRFEVDIMLSRRLKPIPSADGVPIQYDDYGIDSPTLVFVHGWSCDRTCWSEQVGPLSARYRVITIDLGGHGQSGIGRKDWRMASFGVDVTSVVEFLDLNSVVLIGHSMGGDVILQTARLIPDRVKAIIMLDTYKQLGVWKSDSEIDTIIAKLNSDFVLATERYVRGRFPAHAAQSLVNRVATDMAAAPPAVALSSLRSSLSHARKVPALIEKLEIPVVAINPDDAPTDVASMRDHGVDVVIMTGVGHFLMMEEPEKFNEVLLSTLNDLL